MESSFNLIDEEWLQVVYLDGRPAEISLRQLFVDAPRIKELSGDIPQQKLPLLRLALALMYRAYAKPGLNDVTKVDLWESIWNSHQFDMGIFDAYFAIWHDQFFLLGDRPFFQISDLEYAGDKEFDSVSEMIADVPKPEKYLFAMRDQRSADSLSLPEAARWLVFLQAYDTAGIKTPVVGNTHVNKGKVYAPKGVVGTGWLGALGGIYAEGRDLFETLMLNWCLLDQTKDSETYPLFGNASDVPVWEREESSGPDMAMVNAFAGPVQALTWQSRRVRLVPNEDGTAIIGLVNCYGDCIAPHDTDAFEKMTAWRLSEPQRKKLGLAVAPRMPVTHDPSKALWRGLQPILQVAEHGDCRPGVIRWIEHLSYEEVLVDRHILVMVTLHAQGMTYGTQNSVYETGIDDDLTLSTMMFRQDFKGIDAVVDVVDRTDQAVFALTGFVRNLRTAAGDKSVKTQLVADQVRESAYVELDQLFRDRLANFTSDCDPDGYAAQWRDEVHRRLMDMGRDYLSQSLVPVFEEHEAKNLGVMSAARAQLLFWGALNKALGKLPAADKVDSAQEKGE